MERSLSESVLSASASNSTPGPSSCVLGGPLDNLGLPRAMTEVKSE